MIRSVQFLSLEKARRLVPRRDALMVSILDLQERQRHRLPRLAGYRSVLSLSFEDTAEETKLAAPGAWHDDPSDEEHARFAQHLGERIPTLADASRIVDFVRRHHDGEEVLDLLIHCHAGVSRSGAIAQWAIGFTGAEAHPGGPQGFGRPNRRLLRLLSAAAGEMPETAPAPRQPRP